MHPVRQLKAHKINNQILDKDQRKIYESVVIKAFSRMTLRSKIQLFFDDWYVNLTLHKNSLNIFILASPSVEIKKYCQYKKCF